MHFAINRLKNLPFSSRLIKETHKELLKGVRGKYKTPGSFRKSQNWIGGASISDAVFVPPTHTSVIDFMSDIEKFANSKSILLPELLKIALIHYQFETIHPFLDGNRRVGRLLIPLYLVDKKILKKPVLHLSDFFEKNRTLYYDNLTIVRTKNDIYQWLKFFLVGVIETAKKSINTFNNVLQLKQQVDKKIISLGSRAKNARKLLVHLYKNPIINTNAAGNVVGVSATTILKLISDLEKQNILSEMTGRKRNKLYIFADYLKLFTNE